MGTDESGKSSENSYYECVDEYPNKNKRGEKLKTEISYRNSAENHQNIFWHTSAGLKKKVLRRIESSQRDVSNDPTAGSRVEGTVTQLIL